MIRTTVERLKTRLQTITLPNLEVIGTEPKEHTDIGSFPCAVVSLDPETRHEIRMAAHGLARHDYTIIIWLFVGGRAQVPLEELYDRCIDWPEKIARALYADITLSDTVEWIGDGASDSLFTYQIGGITWADRELFGLTIALPVTEKTPMVMAP